MKELISQHKKRSAEIRSRLREFSRIHEGKAESIFPELCFCLLTANANALKCAEAIDDLKRSGLVLKGAAGSIRPKLRGRVRFHNKKAVFIVNARKVLPLLKKVIDPKDVMKTRDWLVENIKGLGYKEASHFLRNIGLGRDIAILDRHILKNLARYGVITKIPDSVGSRKIYLDIEDKMRKFAKKAGIPMDEMDLLFWSIQTGFVFK